ncbi:inositol 2-dehydrogenase [Ruminococcus sp. OA3]|uniref:inositol 2-dehydrogenase n=1 Tax=Ruminococcus sp. OA3 TaxID=2914164 RepID=UPI001F068B39|nr:inositol 2-dehydrogenase [Ruminococcus sp. OA3]MCH1984052.1 inositol 2-dehydrogenase [Ruminococcus sp. OA3]
MKKTVLGIIGGGNVGRIHAKDIVTSVTEAELRYVADAYPDAYNEWAKTNGCPEAVTDYKTILNDPEVDAVLICAPAALHGQLIEECARAGKHVFCEKPIDYSIEAIKEAIRISEECRIKLQLGYNRRFDHNHATAHRMVAEGKIGEVRQIKITSRDPLPPPPEYFAAVGGSAGGMFLDTSIHDFDMARFMACGAEVTEVYATGSAMINKDQETTGGVDTTSVILKFDSGAMAIIDNCWQCAYGYDQRIEVFGSKGAVNVANDTASTVVLANEEGQTAEKPLFFYVNRYIASYTDEIHEFIDAIVNDRPVPVNAKDGYYSVLIAKACDISLQEKRVVTMSEMLAL